jgi:hypothetical protein
MSKTVFESPDKGQTVYQRPFRQGIEQVKSKWYYVFWGIMAAAVCAGQVYVGLGYREMAKATKSTAISVNCEVPVVPYVESGGNRSNFE